MGVNNRVRTPVRLCRGLWLGEGKFVVRLSVKLHLSECRVRNGVWFGVVVGQGWGWTCIRARASLGLALRLRLGVFQSGLH